MMNRSEFMFRLAQLLADLSQSERSEALQYYQDYFDDAGPENEQRIIAVALALLRLLRLQLKRDFPRRTVPEVNFPSQALADMVNKILMRRGAIAVRRQSLSR